MSLRYLGGLSLLLPLLLAAAQPKLSLVPPEGSIEQGSTISIELIALNTESTEVVFANPSVIPVTLYAGSEQWQTVLEKKSSALDPLSAGEFRRATYHLDLPSGASGRLMLEALTSAEETLRTTIFVRERQGPPPVQNTDTAPEKPPARFGTAPVHTQEATDFQRDFIARLAPHEPMYFVYGDERLAAKFQISFKYRLLSFSDGEGSVPKTSFQFGYTQQALWEIESASSPFYDTSYIPSLFYEWIPSLKRRDGWFHWLGLQTGIRHESNGQSGSDSRSLNVFTGRSAWAIGPLDGWHLRVIPELYGYVGGLSNNEDLDKYRAFGQLRVIFSTEQGPALAYTGRVGEDFSNFTTQLDFTIPVETNLLDFGTYLLIQYFNGYGENLLDYNVHSSSLRFGISFVR